jgi:radical SAM superfamily enzyme YgiQ (UPF0313 family)
MNVLLVNPPLYDFAAHNFWMKPYGLLQIATVLKLSGSSVCFFDFCDTLHQSITDRRLRRDSYGRSKLPAKVVGRPAPFASFNRRYRRYGLPISVFACFLDEQLSEKGNFDAALITSSMTYWYPGVFEVIQFLKERFGRDFPIFVGGTYSTLCSDHLRSKLTVNGIYTRNGWLGESFPLPDDFDFQPADFSLYKNLSFGVTRLSRGCPFRCTYCASAVLEPKFRLRPLDLVWEELRPLAKRNVRDIAFYDDSLLTHSEHLKAFAEAIKRENFNFRFHTPNGLHARYISPEVARLLKETSFETIFIGYECADEKILTEIGGKVFFDEVKYALQNLKDSGFPPQRITLYALIGHPKIGYEALEHSISEAEKLGVRIMLAEYSPIPQTPDGETALKRFSLDAHQEPLFSNNTYFTELVLGTEKVQRLKDRVRLHNQRIAGFLK